MFFHPFFMSPPGPLSVTQPAKGTAFAVSMFPSDTAGLCCFTTAGLCGCPQGIPTSRRGSHVLWFLIAFPVFGDSFSPGSEAFI